MELENLFETSIRGAKFFISRSTREAGRKQASFEFVNTGRRSVQDLGKYEPVFEITGFLMGRGDEYIANREALINALETEGAALLVHPFEGNLTVTTGRYTLDESTRSLGYSEIRFKALKVNVDIISSQGNPFTQAGDEITPASIANDAQTAKDSLAEDIANNVTLIPEFPANFESVESIIQSTLSTYSDSLSPIADNIDNAVNWVNGINALSEDVSRLLDTPEVLFANVIDTITGVDNLTNNAQRAYAGMANLFDYGTTDDTNPQVTSSAPILDSDSGTPGSQSSEQVFRTENANQSVLSSRAASLIEAMNQASRIDFQNDEEIDDVVTSIEVQFNDISPQLDSNSLTDLSKLRTNLRILLNRRRLNTNFIIEIDVQNEPASVLAYNLYADSEKSEEIIELNNVKDVFSISGTIKVESNDTAGN